MITEAELRILRLRSLQQLHHTPLIEINLHGTVVLPQHILRISEQSQGNPKKVFSHPLGTGLGLVWAPVCSGYQFWPLLLNLRMP